MQQNVTYLIRREQKDICAGGVHLVTLTRMNGLLLHSLDLQRLELLIENLTLKIINMSSDFSASRRIYIYQIHDNTLVDWKAVCQSIDQL